jgi:hypothetical protein
MDWCQLPTVLCILPGYPIRYALINVGYLDYLFTDMPLIYKSTTYVKYLQPELLTINPN